MPDGTPMPSSFDDDKDFFENSLWKKITTPLKESPLVGLGCLLTTWALYNAQQSIKSGNSVRTNRYFRYRLYAQGFTILALVGGAIYSKADRLKSKEYRKLLDDQKAQDMREKWIKELEARDAEDKEWKEKLGKVQRLQREEAEDLRQIDDARKKKAVNAGEKEEGAKKDLKKVRDEMAKEDQRTLGGVASGQEPAATERPEYKPLIEESEAGGFLGKNTLKRVYEKKVKPVFTDLVGSGEKPDGKQAEKSEAVQEKMPEAIQQKTPEAGQEKK